MFIDFSKIEGVTEEMLSVLSRDDVQQYAEESFNNRSQVVLGDSKSAFKAKMDALDAKLKAAESERDALAGKLSVLGDIDPDEIPVLIEAKKKTPQLTGMLDELKAKHEATLKNLQEKEKSLIEQGQRLQDMQLEHTIASAVADFNTKHPAVSVKPDMQEFVYLLAKSQFKEEDGAFVPHKSDGSPVMTDKGRGDALDWLNILRTEKPSFFNVPTGSGATGSKSSGSAKKYAEMTEAERVALYRADPAEFHRKKGIEQ